MPSLHALSSADHVCVSSQSVLPSLPVDIQPSHPSRSTWLHAHKPSFGLPHNNCICSNLNLDNLGIYFIIFYLNNLAKIRMVQQCGILFSVFYTLANRQSATPPHFWVNCRPRVIFPHCLVQPCLLQKQKRKCHLQPRNRDVLPSPIEMPFWKFQFQFLDELQVSIWMFV